MKDLVYIFFVLIATLFGEPMVNETEAPPPQIISPVSGSLAHLDGGRTLVIQNGFSLRFFNVESGEMKDVFLRTKSIQNPGRCSFSNKFIFLPGEKAAVSFREDKAILSDCCFFNRDGNLLKEFPPSSTDIKYDIPLDGAFFVGERLLVIRGGEREFIYNLYTEEIKSTPPGAFCVSCCRSKICLFPKAYLFDGSL